MVLVGGWTTPAAAAVVVVNISGHFGAVGRHINDAFSGTFTYDTANLAYDGGTSVLYGNQDGLHANAGNYSITWEGVTYASAVRYVQFAQEPDCGFGFGACAYVDFKFQSAVAGYEDGRLTAFLDPTAPFDGHLLPDTAITSASARFAIFQMPENLVGNRYATTAANANFTYPGPGASLSFGGVPAVPEPTTWTMLIAGFGGIGGIARHRATRARVARA